MKLLEALQILNEASAGERPVRRYALACGFTPLALETFLRAHLQRRRPEVRVELDGGLFGDLAGNVERAGASGGEGVAVVVEWGDLDPRLAARNGAALGPTFADDVVESVAGALERLTARVVAAAARVPVAISTPTLPLPAVFQGVAGAAAAALRLRERVGASAAAWAATPNVRVVDPQRLDLVSPLSTRGDVAAECATGFPYQRAHAEAVASTLAALLHPAAAKKGIITDLDNTLWGGIVGEVGVAGVRWGMEHGAQAHALYQQCLAALADAGVLVAIASKNDPEVVAEALRREDLLVPAAQIFPVFASWGPKSAAVADILATWNVGEDSVVFVDDSPLEIAEVQARFPGVEGVLFEPDSVPSVVAAVARLRDLFGKDGVRDEDRLRAASIRAGAAAKAEAAGAEDDETFLSGLAASLALEVSSTPDDGRAFELVNKTNQFNVNGRRYTPAEWAGALARPGAFVITVAYADKFGPLGKIAVVLGTASAGEVRVDGWVMSCRSFSRRVEHATLDFLFSAFDAAAVTVDYAPTPRNGPSSEFLARFAALPGGPGVVRVGRAAFEAARPPLYHARAERGRADRAVPAAAGAPSA